MLVTDALARKNKELVQQVDNRSTNTIHKTDQKVYDACYLACVTKFKLAPLCSEMFKIDVWAKTENSFVQEVNNRSTIAG